MTDATLSLSLISPLLTAADHGEPVPLLLQPFGGETANTTAGSCDQPVLWISPWCGS